MSWLSNLSRRDPVLARVKELVAEAEAWRDVRGKPMNGERKRSYAYNRLVSEFPNSRKRDLGYLIEKVLQDG